MSRFLVRLILGSAVGFLAAYLIGGGVVLLIALAIETVESGFGEFSTFTVEDFTDFGIFIFQILWVQMSVYAVLLTSVFLWAKKARAKWIAPFVAVLLVAPIYGVSYWLHSFSGATSRWTQSLHLGSMASAMITAILTGAVVRKFLDILERREFGRE